MAIPKKPRKCRVCKSDFQPARPLQNVCGPACAIVAATAKRQKDRQIVEVKERQEAKKKLASLTPGHLAKKAQEAVNAYVRERDRHEGCISCDKPASWHGQWHASHLKSRGANSYLRFNLWNLHKACSVCNSHLSGNIAEYERGIVTRYGQARLDYLNSAPKSRKYTDDYLIRLARIFRKKTRLLKARNELY